MNPRTVAILLPARAVDMDGIPVRQAFPTQRVGQIDPFLLLHHADLIVPAEHNPDHEGVGPHPHRGFSPVTFIFAGGVHHRDSRGHDSTVYAGGAQWMNAGMGIVHSERPARNIHALGGKQEIVQLWINTPGRHKMDQPAYFALQPEDVPALELDEGRAAVKVFSGQVLGLKGPIPSPVEVNALTLQLRQGARIVVLLPTEHNALVYLLDGSVRVDAAGAVNGQTAVVFANDGDHVALRAVKNTRALLLSGKPIGEEVVKHGPFVMNTHTEILEAMRDYQMGRMGILIEE